MEDRPANVQVVSRLRWDGARYAQHAPRQPGQKGRRRRRGDRLAALQLWGAKPRAGSIGDAYGVLELLWLLVTTVQAWMRPRQDLVLENLLLRHQLAVLARPNANPTTCSASYLGQAALGPGAPVVCRLA